MIKGFNMNITVKELINQLSDLPKGYEDFRIEVLIQGKDINIFSQNFISIFDDEDLKYIELRFN
jgi:hypothetical protein